MPHYQLAQNEQPGNPVAANRYGMFDASSARKSLDYNQRLAELKDYLRENLLNLAFDDVFTASQIKSLPGTIISNLEELLLELSKTIENEQLCDFQTQSCLIYNIEPIEDNLYSFDLQIINKNLATAQGHNNVITKSVFFNDQGILTCDEQNLDRILSCTEQALENIDGIQPRSMHSLAFV